MHYPRSTSASKRFKLAAVLLFANFLLVPVAVTLLIHSMIFHDLKVTMAGSGILVFSMVLIVTQWIAGSATVCPLCMTPVLAPKSCMKHRRARSVMGSHRLRVALAILFMDRFRCPYCNESTVMEVRETIHRRRHPQVDRSIE